MDKLIAMNSDVTEKKTNYMVIVLFLTNTQLTYTKYTKMT